MHVCSRMYRPARESCHRASTEGKEGHICTRHKAPSPQLIGEQREYRLVMILSLAASHADALERFRSWERLQLLPNPTIRQERSYLAQCTARKELRAETLAATVW